MLRIRSKTTPHAPGPHPSGNPNQKQTTMKPLRDVLILALAATGKSVQGAWLGGLLAVLPPFCQAETGVFIFNQTFSHPASSASALRYVAAENKPPVTVFTLTNGQHVTIVPSQPLVILRDFGLRAGDTVTSQNAASYVQALNEYKAAYNKYPNSRPLLKEQIAELEDAVTKLRNGQAWFEGRWVDEAEVARTLATRKEQSAQKIRKNKQAEQLAPVDQKIQSLERELITLRARVKEASDRNAKVAEDYKKVTDEVGQAVRTLLKQPES